MKTEPLSGSNNSGDPIWASNVELLPSEECLPIIGSCQVSSILQNLDSTQTDSNLQNMDLIILHGNDYKLPLENPLNLHNNSYIVLKDNISVGDSPPSDKQQPTDLSLNIVLETSNSSHTSSVSPKHYDKESFEEMLYFVCNLCPLLCTQETKIIEHLETVHKNKTVSKQVQLKCPACANIFYHRASLKSHLLHDHCVANSDLNLIVQAVMFYSNKENKKENKNEKSSTVEKLLEALSDESKDKPQITKQVVNIPKPPLVNRIITVPATLTERKIPLPQLDLAVNNNEKLVNLMKKAEPQIKYNTPKCVYATCKVQLSDMNKMDYHIDCHWNDGFKCLECQEKFHIWKQLTSHLWRLHKLDMELYACDKCNYKTNSLSKLNSIHKLIHSTVKAYECDVCRMRFKNQKQLSNHKRIHKQDVEKTVYRCEVCAKGFSDKRRLKIHMDSVHKKLKPFLCSYCGYKGSSKASLRMHIRSHTGEKPYICNLCAYSTSDHNSLRRHKLRHEGDKPYKCLYCSYACIQSSTYKVHLKTKHPGMEKDLMFTCFMCQFRTVNKDMYFTHLVTVHNQKPPS